MVMLMLRGGRYHVVKNQVEMATLTGLIHFEVVGTMNIGLTYHPRFLTAVSTSEVL